MPSLSDARQRLEIGDFPAFNRNKAGESLGKQHFLRKGGISLSTKPLPLDRHRHGGFELHYIAKGRLSLEYEGGGRVDLRGGSACVIQPGLLHWGQNDIIPPARLFWLVVNPNRIYRGYHDGEQEQLALRLRQLGNRVVHQLPDGDLYFQIVQRAFNHAEQEPNDPVVMAQLRYSCMVFLHYLVDALSTEDSSTEASREPHSAIAQVTRYLEQHVVEDISITQLAELSGLSLSRFHELFRQEVGTSPAQFHLGLRAQHAQQLLADDPSAAIADVAKQCGFASGRHFAAVFRKHFGVSPSQYRHEVQRYD